MHDIMPGVPRLIKVPLSWDFELTDYKNYTEVILRKRIKCKICGSDVIVGRTIVRTPELSSVA